MRTQLDPIAKSDGSDEDKKVTKLFRRTSEKADCHIGIIKDKVAERCALLTNQTEATMSKGNAHSASKQKDDVHFRSKGLELPAPLSADSEAKSMLSLALNTPQRSQRPCAESRARILVGTSSPPEATNRMVYVITAVIAYMDRLPE